MHFVGAHPHLHARLAQHAVLAGRFYDILYVVVSVQLLAKFYDARHVFRLHADFQAKKQGELRSDDYLFDRALLHAFGS